MNCFELMLYSCVSYLRYIFTTNKRFQFTYWQKEIYLFQSWVFEQVWYFQNWCYLFLGMILRSNLYYATQFFKIMLYIILKTSTGIVKKGKRRFFNFKYHSLFKTPKFWFFNKNSWNIWCPSQLKLSKFLF